MQSRLDQATFDAIVAAQAIAVIGASSNPESLSGRPLDYLRQHGYEGRVYPVNPARDEVQGYKAYPSIAEVPEPVELAMVAVRAELVPAMLAECVEAGVKVAIVVSSGFGEGRGQGAELAEELAAIVERAEGRIRVIGPNCEGIWSTPNRMPFTFSPVADREKTGRVVTVGDVAVVSHSGGLSFAVAQWGSAVGLGFSYVFSMGNELDLDATTLAEAVIERDDTRVLVLLLETFGDRERVLALGDRARRLGKHVVAARLGRSAAGRRAAYAHSLHESGADEELAAEAGIHLASDEDDLVDTVQVLSAAPAMAGRRVAVVATSGGAGVWLADALDAAGLEIPPLSAAVQEALAPHLPAYGSTGNPVDVTAQFFAGGDFARVLGVLCESGEVDGVAITTSLGAAGRLEGQRAGLAGIRAAYDLPIVMFSYTTPAQANVEILQELAIPYFPTSRRTARALARLAR